MTFLASLHSNLGRISLHATRRGFETRRTYADRITGEDRITRIPMSREQAQEWYLTCLHRGLVRRPFPEEVTP